MESSRRRRERIARNRDLRRNSTPAEKKLWEALRGRRFRGLKFRRQHGIGPYVADFCCLEHRLILEVDGGIHDSPEQARKDVWRTENLEGADWVVFRLRNEDVFEDLEGCLERLSRFLESPHP